MTSSTSFIGRLLEERSIPSQQTRRYPVKLPHDISPTLHYLVGGSNIEGIRYRVSLTMVDSRVFLEFHTKDLKCDSTKLEEATSAISQLNADEVLNFSLSTDDCSFRFSANLWIDDTWTSLTKQAALLSSLKVYNNIFKETTKSDLIRSLQYKQRMVSYIPNETNIQHLATCLDELLRDGGIETFDSVTSEVRILTKYRAEYFPPTTPKRRLKYSYTVEITEDTARFTIDTSASTTINHETAERLYRYINKISACLKFSHLNARQDSIFHFSTASEYKHRFIADENVLKQVFKACYNLTLFEFKYAISEFMKILDGTFEGKINFVSLSSLTKVLEYSDIEEDSEDQEKVPRTHYKLYESENIMKEERQIINKLREAGLLENFGLDDSVIVDDSFTSLTFHAPPEKKFIQIKEATVDLTYTWAVLEKLLVSLRQVGLAIPDISNVDLYYNGKGESRKLFVHCEEHLHDILKPCEETPQISKQCQDYFVSLIKPYSKMHTTTATPNDSLTNIVFLSEPENMKTFLGGIQGVDRAVIYTKSCEMMSLKEVDIVLHYLYRAYQLHRHPGILTCYGYKYKRSKEVIYFAYEACCCTLQAFTARGYKLTQPLKFVREVAQTLGYLSSKSPIRVMVSPRRIMVTAKFKPKLKPFCYRDSSDIRYLTPYEDLSVDWTRSLAYSFGLILLYVATGQDVQYGFPTFVMHSRDQFLEYLKVSQGPLITTPLDSGVQQLVEYSLKATSPDFKLIIAKLDELEASCLDVFPV
jgi:hypothetical protein